MSANELWHLPWKVSDSGYYLKYEGYISMGGRSKNFDIPYLVQKESGGSCKSKSYNDYPSTIFEDFADLSQSKSLEKDALKFANKHGWLGEYKEIIDPSTQQSFLGEPISTWNVEIWRIKYVVDMWNSLRRGDGFYGQHIIWVNTDTPVFAIGEHFSSVWDIEKKLKDEGYDRFVTPHFRWVEPLPQGVWDYPDPKGPANYFVAKTINERLNPERGSRLISRVRPMVYLDKSNVFNHSFMPSNLLALIWTKFYEAVAVRKFRYCEICNRLLDVTEHTNAKRVHDKCSSRERQRRLYYRKKNV